jgi:hypothetical protein
MDNLPAAGDRQHLAINDGVIDATWLDNPVRTREELEQHARQQSGSGLRQRAKP